MQSDEKNAEPNKSLWQAQNSYGAVRCCRDRQESDTAINFSMATLASLSVPLPVNSFDPVHDARDGTVDAGSPSWQGPRYHYAGYVCARPSEVINSPIANGCGPDVLEVQPRFRSQTSSALRPIDTAFSSCNHATISLNMMSFSSSIMPMINSLGHQGANRRVSPASQVSPAPPVHWRSRRGPLKCQFQIGPQLGAPTCHPVTIFDCGCRLFSTCCKVSPCRLSVAWMA